MGIVRDLYYARKMSAGLKLPAPTVALLIKQLRLAAAMGGGVEKTVSGTMVHITDALAKAALSVLASIEPIQDLHGYANPWPAGGGKNICPPDGWVQGQLQTNGSINVVSYAVTSPYILLTGGQTYTLSRNYPDYGDGQLAYHTYDLSKTHLSDSSWKPNNYAFTPESDCYIRITTRAKPQNQDPPALTPNDVGTMFVIQLELGSTATAFEPYENICPITGRTGLDVYAGPTSAIGDATTYSMDWTSESGTVYGGTLDVVTGVLTVDRAQISSYAGETLPGAWISDRDAYAAGTTPTTGAQVVYELATPLTYQLTAQVVQMLLGENYVWSSSGDTVSVAYYAEGNANTLQSLNILLGGRYSNPKTADDVSDKEALEIILGGNK